jgi:hypothetical protein
MLALLLASTSVMGGLAQDHEAGGRPRVLLIAREVSGAMEFMITSEVLPMIELVERGGYAVDVASESGLPIAAGNATLVPRLRLADADLRDYAGIIVPCMAVGDLPGGATPHAKDLLALAAASTKPIAMQHSKELILATPLSARRWSQSMKSGIVRDGNLISSFTCPSQARNTRPIPVEETPLLVAAFLEMLDGQMKK